MRLPGISLLWMGHKSAIVIAVFLFSTQHASSQPENGNMVKMCLFYQSASGHARSDPIINQECASDHIHTVCFACYVELSFLLCVFTSPLTPDHHSLASKNL